MTHATDIGARFAGRPTLVLIGEDGNAFAILGAARKALRRAGATTDEIDGFIARATAGDYDYLLAVVMDEFEVE